VSGVQNAFESIKKEEKRQFRKLCWEEIRYMEGQVCAARKRTGKNPVGTKERDAFCTAFRKKTKTGLTSL